ncbi:MAG: hypothetical protein DMF94_33260 [Acidobacteria bacterium]|nr:MAG: hypothetical protein DMF94_33260 [Acidobacteriota bacterium]
MDLKVHNNLVQALKSLAGFNNSSSTSAAAWSIMAGIAFRATDSTVSADSPPTFEHRSIFKGEADRKGSSGGPSRCNVPRTP